LLAVDLIQIHQLIYRNSADFAYTCFATQAMLPKLPIFTRDYIIVFKPRTKKAPRRASLISHRYMLKACKHPEYMVRVEVGMADGNGWVARLGG